MARRRAKRGRIKNVANFVLGDQRSKHIKQFETWQKLFRAELQPNLIEDEDGYIRYKHNAHVFQEAALSFADRVNYKTEYFFVAKTGFAFIDSYILMIANMANMVRNSFAPQCYNSSEIETDSGFMVHNLPATTRLLTLAKIIAKAGTQIFKYIRDIEQRCRENPEDVKYLVFHDPPMSSIFEYHCIQEYYFHKIRTHDNKRTKEKTNQMLFHLVMKEKFFSNYHYSAAIDDYITMRISKSRGATEYYRKLFGKKDVFKELDFDLTEQDEKNIDQISKDNE